MSSIACVGAAEVRGAGRGQVDRMTECGTCSGSGAKAGTSPTTCSACGGAGQVATAVRTPLGVFQQVQDCRECMGTGERTTPCTTCGGDGRVRKTKRIRCAPSARIANAPVSTGELISLQSMFVTQSCIIQHPPSVPRLFVSPNPRGCSHG